MAGPLTVDFVHRYEAGAEVAASLTRTLAGGSVLVVFGPSGAGKTTVLRAIAGLLEPTAGRIAFGERVWFDSANGLSVEAQARGVGYVAQDTALFPHLTVRANVEYGLRTFADRRHRAAEMLRLVNMMGVEGRMPRQLSGGQAQRVALARALAPEPALLVLDEPFGALDAATRRALRTEVRDLLRRRGLSAILVTHDRTEAMAMGDELAVMIDGRIRQAGEVADVFRRPADPDTARLLGIDTVLPARVEEVTEGLATLRIGAVRLVAVSDATARTGDVYACVRAEDVIVEPHPSRSDSARNHLMGTVREVESEGAVDRLIIDCGFPLVAAVTHRSRLELGLAAGSVVTAAIKATAIHIVPKA